MRLEGKAFQQVQRKKLVKLQNRKSADQELQYLERAHFDLVVIYLPKRQGNMDFYNVVMRNIEAICKHSMEHKHGPKCLQKVRDGRCAVAVPA